MEKGIKRLADLNVYLGFFLCAFVLAVGPTTGAVLHNVQVAADLVEVTNDIVVLATPERSEGSSGRGCLGTTPPGGCDLNGDGDANDLVIRLYDASTAKLTEIGQAVVDFVVGDQVIAFRTRESDQGNAYLNADLDTGDEVMQVFDLATATLINTRLAADVCYLPGCDPAIPYKAKGRTVSFLTDEVDQQDDLNGDGDQDDIVLTVYDVVSRKPQFLDTVSGFRGSKYDLVTQ